MENIVLDGKRINLNSLSIEKLQEILEKVEVKESGIKQEINSLLQSLT